MKKLTYKKSGVDIDATSKAIDLIKPLIAKTFNPSVLYDIGGFGGFFDIGGGNVLTACTDGVGSKLKIAFALDKHDTVGIDLVAMCVNDVITTGSKPLFFLDYIGINKVEPQKIKQIAGGIVAGCKISKCALLGGEIAELPDLYKKGEYDLAGFTVGIVKKDKIIDGSKIKPGNVIIGLPSSGLHSNGYTLVRRVLKESKINIKEKLGKEILKPTKIYTNVIMRLVGKIPILGIAHITGGGLKENIKRVLPKGCSVLINKDSWQIPPIFKKIQKLGEISEKEMYKVFNMGIGMVVIISEKDSGKTKRLFKEKKEKFYIIGKVIKQASSSVFIK